MTTDRSIEGFKPTLKPIAKVDPNQLLHAEDLLNYYSFSLEGRSAPTVLREWATVYPVEWIRLAIIEALYQGRYKVVSVEQLLQQWQRRQEPQPRFDGEFEKLICDRFPRNLMQPTSVEASAVSSLAAEIRANARAKSDDIKTSEEAALAALARFVQNRKSLGASVDGVIDQAEANIDRVANQAKQSIGKQRREGDANDETESTAAVETGETVDSRSIHQFIPKAGAADLVARLKSVSETAAPQAAAVEAAVEITAVETGDN
jgi:hypothetical protein